MNIFLETLHMEKKLTSVTPKTQLIKIIHFFDSFELVYGRLLGNLKAGFSRKLFLPENDFKTCSAELLMSTAQDVKLRPTSLSNPLDQMSLINYQNLFGCAINKANH